MQHYTRLERLTRDKHPNLLGPLASYEENKVMWICVQWLYTQHFIFFVTLKYTQQVRVLLYTRLKKLAKDKHSSILRPFMSYEENIVLWIWLDGLYSQQFIFFITFKWAQKARVLHYTRLERLVKEKCSTLLKQFIIYKENKVLRIWFQGLYSQDFIFFLTWDRSTKLEGHIKLFW